METAKIQDLLNVTHANQDPPGKMDNALNVKHTNAKVATNEGQDIVMNASGALDWIKTINVQGALILGAEAVITQMAIV